MPPTKTRHTVIVSIAVQAVLEVESTPNEQGVFGTVNWLGGGTSPFLLSAVPVGPRVSAEDAKAIGRIAMTDVAQKLLTRISQQETKVEPATVLTPPQGQVN